jgi:hypothetical protein
MSYLGARNAISLGVSYQATLGGPNLLNKLSPSLLLNFTNTSTLDPRITFTRSTTATFTGSNGLIQSAAINEPRFDYNPTTLASLGLLIEEQRVNLVLRSEEFENVAWGAGLGTTRTANTNIAPNGTTTADTITEDSATSVHVIVQAAIASGQVTFSVFAKAGSGSRFLTISVSRAATHYGSSTFDLSTQTSTQTLIAGYTGSVTTAVSASAQGFYRYSITLTTDTLSDVRIGLSATSTFANFSRGFDSYTGNGTSSLILWGAQLEAGAFPTSYIPTVASQVTRAADFASITGTNFSDWYNATEGTLYGEFNISLGITPLASPRVFSLLGSGGTAVNEIVLLVNQSSNKAASFNSFTSSVNAGRIDASANYVANTITKAVGSYALNNRAVTANGFLATVSTTAYTIPTLTSANIGCAATNNNTLNGHIRQIVYYPRRLGNAELQGITR